MIICDTEENTVDTVIEKAREYPDSMTLSVSYDFRKHQWYVKEHVGNNYPRWHVKDIVLLCYGIRCGAEHSRDEVLYTLHTYADTSE